MSQPFKKPSERLRRLPKDKGFKPDDDPRDILRKKLFRFVNTRLGWPLAAALVFLVALCTLSLPAFEKRIVQDRLRR